MSLKSDLQKPYLFQNLTEDELNLVQTVAEVRTYVRNDHLFNQGDAPEAFYIIQYGSVRAEALGSEGDHDYGYGLLGNGAMFGEAAFLSRTPRFVTATATEDANVIRIPFQALQNLLDENPELAIKVYQSLAKHLGHVVYRSMIELTRLREQSDHRK